MLCNYDKVDGRHPANQLRVVVDLTMYNMLYTQKMQQVVVWLFGISEPKSCNINMISTGKVPVNLGALVKQFWLNDHIQKIREITCII